MNRFLSPPKFIALTAITALGLVGFAPAHSCNTGHTEQTEANSADIVDTAVQAGSFTTLVTAVQAAGLEGALRGEGPFTVFAPTDAAFAALPEGALDALIANPEQLQQVLLYHVVEGNVPSSTAVTLDTASTLQGSALDLNVEGNSLKINGATVVTADVNASNGVIHVIDTVLIPPQESAQASTPGADEAR